MSKQCCPQHGERMIKRGRWDHEEDRFRGAWFGCPRYGECGFWFDDNTKSPTFGSWRQSKKFR